MEAERLNHTKGAPFPAQHSTYSHMTLSWDFGISSSHQAAGQNPKVAVPFRGRKIQEQTFDPSCILKCYNIRWRIWRDFWSHLCGATCLVSKTPSSSLSRETITKVIKRGTLIALRGLHSLATNRNDTSPSSPKPLPTRTARSPGLKLNMS